jgi:glycosyltransferase involved in cell wall biosynthesis
MKKTSLVSVLVTTRNNTATLDACLASISAQTYPAIELIVVDNRSTDDTKAIARRYTKLVFNKGPERSVQRNFAVAKARGDYVCIIDSDMELLPEVIASCVATVQQHPEARAVIIPEESFGIGFWAQCKRLERSFYVGQDAIEAARFFGKAVYAQAGGYDESMVGGEDWDLSQRVRAVTTIARSQVYIRHNEGHLNLYKALKKRFYYTVGFVQYFQHQGSKTASAPAASVCSYYGLFLSKPGRLLRNPAYGIGMLFMKTCEFGANALGYVSAKRKLAREEAV